MSYTVNDVMAELPLIADAIRAKEGTTEPIPFIDYKNRIAALKGEEIIDYSLLDTPPIDAEPLVAWDINTFSDGDTVLKNTGTLGADIQLVGDGTATRTIYNVTNFKDLEVLKLANKCAYIAFPSALTTCTIYAVIELPTWASGWSLQVGGATADDCVGIKQSSSLQYRTNSLTGVITSSNKNYRLAVVAITAGGLNDCKIYINDTIIYNFGMSTNRDVHGVYINSSDLIAGGAAGTASSSTVYLKELYVYDSVHTVTQLQNTTAWLLARTKKDWIFDEASEEETPATPTIPDDPYDIVETKPLLWFDSSCVTDATTITNKGTSTDVINAVGLAVDSDEDAILLASETGAFYTDLTAFSEATVYVIYKASALGAYYQGEKGCSLRAATKDCSVVFYCNETSSSKGTHNYISRVGKNDTTYYTDDSDYVTAASASKSTLHRAYCNAANIRLGDNNATYSFNRLAANCQYTNDTPLTTIPKNTLLVKAILVYDEFHDSATVKKMTEWLNAKYTGL